MIRALFFDFDGTIADTLPGIREAVNLSMRAHGFPEHDRESVLGFVNYGIREYAYYALPEHLREDEKWLDLIQREYVDNYGKVCLTVPTPPYPGVPELIRAFHDGGYRIGILSNKPDRYLLPLSERVLSPGGFDGTQGCIIGKPPKPDPFMTNELCARLGVLPSECVMVGDSDVDLLTARNAGTEHIGVSWGYRSETYLSSHGTGRIARDAEELRSHLLSLTGGDQLTNKQK